MTLTHKARISRILFCTLWTILHCEAFVPACFSQGTTSGRILCEDVDLSSISPQSMSQAFQGANTLTAITLRRCTINSDILFLTSDVNSNLKHLTLDSINLTGGLTIEPFRKFITSLETLTFRNMPSLESIDFLRSAAIQETWESLTSLIVDSCSLRSVNPDLWPFLPKVERLVFRHNNLTLFDFGNSGFSSLVEIDASYNKIQLLRNLQWESLTALQKFYMSSNRLFDHDIISELPNKVEEIHLDNNVFSRIDLNIAAKSDLKTLILSNNSLQYIHPSFYDSNRRNIEVLGLDGNRGMNISGLLVGMNKLRNLTLKFCYINTIHRQFQNLSSLEYLDLSQNWLENIPALAFQGSTNLRHLNLRSNHLSHLDFLDAPEAPLMNVLHALDLTDNDFDDLPSFDTSPNLRLLSLLDNSLESLSGCNHTEALIKLESFCAPGFRSDTKCAYQTFIQTVQQSASKLKVYNDVTCCTNPVPENPACCLQTGTTCNSKIINSEVLRSCPSPDEMCSYKPPVTVEVITKEVVVTPEPRRAFQNLESTEWFVVVLGYMLALVLLVMIVYLLYREVSADNRRRRLHFQTDADDEMRLEQSNYHLPHNNTPSPLPPKLRTERLDSADSLGSCSLESNSNYSGSDAGACKNSAIVKPDSPSFRGRKKFSDTYSKTSPIKQNGNSNNNAKPPQKMKNYYTAQVQQNENASCSSTESPTNLSVYSYATLPGQSPPQQSDFGEDVLPMFSISAAGARSRSASDVVDGHPPPLPPDRPLMNHSCIRPGIGAKSQIRRFNNRRQSLTTSPLAVHRNHSKAGKRPPLSRSKRMKQQRLSK